MHVPPSGSPRTGPLPRTSPGSPSSAAPSRPPGMRSPRSRPVPSIRLSSPMWRAAAGCSPWLPGVSSCGRVAAPPSETDPARRATLSHIAHRAFPVVLAAMSVTGSREWVGDVGQATQADNVFRFGLPALGAGSVHLKHAPRGIGADGDGLVPGQRPLVECFDTIRRGASDAPNQGRMMARSPGGSSSRARPVPRPVPIPCACPSTFPAPRAPWRAHDDACVATCPALRGAGDRQTPGRGLGHCASPGGSPCPPGCAARSEQACRPATGRS